METGLLFTMPAHKTKGHKSSLNLSIHVYMNGLSFFTYDVKTHHTSKVYRKLFKQHIPVEKLHEHVHAELKAQDLIGQPFNKIRCSVENNLATLVPKSLFEEASLHEYVQKDIDIRTNDFVTYDIFPSADWVNVYVPFVNVNNMLIDAFGSFTYFHAVSVWLNALTKHTVADGKLVWSLYIEHHHLHIVLLRDKKLQFYNCFEATSPKDIAYYTLLTAEKNNISPNEVPLYLVGNCIEDDPTYSELFKFVRSINFLTPENEALSSSPMLNAHQDFCLLSMF